MCNCRAILALLLISGEAVGAPLIRIADTELAQPLVLVAYGDMRFTDPKETDATNPKIRRWLVDKIAEEKPAIILISGDVPYHGGEINDYTVFQSETAPWKAANILVSPALGNHEMYGKTLAKCTDCIENWWNTFPQVGRHRWYSIALGSRVYIVTLDTNSALASGSEQQQWLAQELAALRSEVKFVFINLHHPPVTGTMLGPNADHNARPNEIALVDLIKKTRARQRVQFVVNAGHIHNYERFKQDGTEYLVSGGGGAKPLLVQRGSKDRYKNAPDVNYHYVKFVLRGKKLEAEMIRVADPSAESARWEVKDRFQVKAR